MRVYVDTSVIGGCEDEEFKKWSRGLLNAFAAGAMTAVISDITMRELAPAPAAVRRALDAIEGSAREQVSVGDEARRLARIYLAEKIVMPADIRDAQHIAVATVERVDVMVSWNFKHIVNFRRLQLYNAVNLKEGYRMLDIRTPREMLDEEDV